MSSTTQAINSNENNKDTQPKDAFQDAFSDLLARYFEPEEEEKGENSGDWPPCPQFTPEEEQKIIREWSECGLKQLALTWGEDYVAELRSQMSWLNE